MTTDEVITDPKLDAARARVREVDRRSLYTHAAIDAAAALLVDMLDAGERHGITVNMWDGVTHLAGACLDVTADRMRGEKFAQQAAAELGYAKPADLALHLVDLMHIHLTDVRGVATVHRPGSYGITFSVGRVRRHVHCAADGWHFGTEGGGPVCHVYAPYTPAGAIVVADTIAELVAGTRPDPLVH